MTYGWWIDNTVYRFNDPDHIVLSPATKPTSQAQARMRLNASVIAGTVMILSDDLTRPEALSRAKMWLTNPKINEIAREGGAFRPVEAYGGQGASDVFVRKDRTRHLVAIFNYDAKKPAVKRINLRRAGMTDSAALQCVDLYSGKSIYVSDSIEVELEPAGSTIVEIVAAPRR